MLSNKSHTFNQRIEKYYVWPLSYLLVMAFMTVWAFYINRTAGIVFLAMLLVSLAVGIAMNLITRKHMMSEIISFALGYSSIQKQHMQAFEIANVIMDTNGKVLWFNEKFECLFSDEDEVNPEAKTYRDKNINGLVPQLSASLFPSEIEETTTKTLEIKDRMYRVLIKHLKVVGEEDSSFEMYHVNDEQVLFNAYFFDITKETQLAIKNENQKAVVSLLYIDNYEEVIHSIEDVRRPLMVALIDRHINKFAKQVDGVLRKFEKDKYILIFQKKHLPNLKEDKFSILDTVREIDIGNELPVTLSIGIGINEYSYVQSLEFARMAIDLALGRGGDQAVIKNNDKFSFYGGKAKGVEKTTRVKARIKAYAFRELIEEADKIIILGHRGQDLDCLGAAIGVYACCKLFGKPAHIVLNEVTTSINVLYDRIIEEGNHPEDLFIKGTDALGYMNENTLLVVVDVNRPSYTENPELLNYVKNVVVFDHHRASTEPILNPVLSYIEPYASSTCEMVTEILRYISDKVKLDPVEADALFAGISVDTKNFVVKAGVKTFEAAAFLRRNGADVTRVRSFFKNDMASYQAKAAAVRDAELYGEEIAISVSPSDVGNPTLVAAQAADELLNISGINASFVLTSVNGTIYISARSSENINVQVIMEEMNGGGHMNMAGAQVKDATIEETTLMLKKAIDTYFEKGDEQ